MRMSAVHPLLFGLIVGLCCFSGISESKRIHWKYQDGFIGQRDNRIVGGFNASEKSAPYQVSIQTIFNTHICGAVIIDEDWILTAGHCVRDYPIEVLRVIVGTNNWRQPRVEVRPQLIVRHCRHDKPDFHNDIAAVRLNQSLVFDEYVQKIEIATEYPKVGDEIILTGWGSTYLFEPPPNELQQISLKYIDLEECRKRWDYDEGIGEGHLCTFTREGQGACNGDSGGPLVANGKLVALVNWGAPCAVGKPDMHANVIYYRDFINLAKNQCMRLKN